MLADDQRVELTSAREILVYRDFSNPHLFYYSSTRPAVARQDGEYQFTIVRYDTPVEGRAGMLSLVVNLRPDASELASMQSELGAQNPGVELQFKQIPWTAGTVVAAIMGANPVFGTPSLLDNNSAVLSLGLTTEQYSLLKNSVENPAAPPISVVYSLSYEAFRPQYSFSIEFDETKFRNWIQKKCSANFLFINVETIDTFEELRQSGVIRVASENQTGEDPPDGFQKAFLQSLRSILTPLPRFAPPSGADTSTWLLGFDCSAVQDIQNISRRLDTNMQISGAVERKAFLQGALAGLKNAMAKQEMELPTNSCFTQRLTVRCHTAFDGEPLDSARVTIEPYPLTQCCRVFGKSTNEWPVELMHTPGTDSDYAYRCDLYFSDTQAKSSSGLVGIRRDQAFLDIVPAAFYTYRRYSVSVADDFPWELVNSIRLTLSGPAALSFAPTQLTLTKRNASGQITAFAPEIVSLDNVVFTGTYAPKLGAAFGLDGLPSGATIYLNPFRRRVVTFQASAAMDWQAISEIAVIVEQSSDNPQIYASARLSISRDAPLARFAYWFGGHKNIRYRAQFRQNGKVLQLKSAVTSLSTITISDRDEPGSQE